MVALLVALVASWLMDEHHEEPDYEAVILAYPVRWG